MIVFMEIQPVTGLSGEIDAEKPASFPVIIAGIK
jgi:hypothetical protein